MVTLGIETSCDETSAALVEDGRRILSNVISSQVELHAAYGGVVPELAARSHVERLPLVLDGALALAGMGLEDVDLVAAAHPDGGHVGLVVHLPEARVADDLVFFAEHDVGRQLVLRELAPVGIARPRSEKDLLLYLLYGGDVV